MSDLYKRSKNNSKVTSKDSRRLQMQWNLNRQIKMLIKSDTESLEDRVLVLFSTVSFWHLIKKRVFEFRVNKNRKASTGFVQPRSLHNLKCGFTTYYLTTGPKFSIKHTCVEERYVKRLLCCHHQQRWYDNHAINHNPNVVGSWHRLFIFEK